MESPTVFFSSSFFLSTTASFLHFDNSLDFSGSSFVLRFWWRDQSIVQTLEVLNPEFSCLGFLRLRVSQA